MSRTPLLAMILFSLASSIAIADEESNARDMARKDLDKAMAKIRTDDAAAVQKCRTSDGPAAEACLIQAHGKRLRAEQEAMARPERIAQVKPLPEKQADAASKNAMGTAKREQRRTAEEINVESKLAGEECKKLNGEARKACSTDVSRRRDEARDLADAMYKKAQSDAKGMKTP